MMSFKTTQILKVFGVGILIYISLVTLFALFYCITGSISYNDTDQKTVTDFWDCVYFSFVSFLTIGYGDIIPTNHGKTILFLESILSIGFTGVFTAKLAFEFLRRPQNILISEKIFIRKSSKRKDKENYDFIIRIGNKGNSMVDCKGVVEFFKISKNIRTTINKISLDYRILETTWNFKFRFYEEGTNNHSPSDNKSFLRDFFFSENGEKQVRFSLSGIDNITGQPVSQIRTYSSNDITYIDSLVDVYDWNNGQRTKSKWENFQKYIPMSIETKQAFNKSIEK